MLRVQCRSLAVQLAEVEQLLAGAFKDLAVAKAAPDKDTPQVGPAVLAGWMRRARATMCWANASAAVPHTAPPRFIAAGL